MNILDENIPEGQTNWLRRKRIHVRQIGVDVRQKGLEDDEIIPLLHELDRPTFLTLEVDFYDRRLRHQAYCLVYLDVVDEDFAEFAHRFLKHPTFNTKAKRMGHVATSSEFNRIHEQSEIQFEW